MPSGQFGKVLSVLLTPERRLVINLNLRGEDVPLDVTEVLGTDWPERDNKRGFPTLDHLETIQKILPANLTIDRLDDKDFLGPLAISILHGKIVTHLAARDSHDRLTILMRRPTG